MRKEEKLLTEKAAALQDKKEDDQCESELQQVYIQKVQKRLLLGKEREKEKEEKKVKNKSSSYPYVCAVCTPRTRSSALSQTLTEERRKKKTSSIADLQDTSPPSRRTTR